MSRMSASSSTTSMVPLLVFIIRFYPRFASDKTLFTYLTLFRNCSGVFLSPRPSRERAGVRVTQGLDNSFEHCLRVPRYIMVPKAQHSIRVSTTRSTSAHFGDLTDGASSCRSSRPLCLHLPILQASNITSFLLVE